MRMSERMVTLMRLIDADTLGVTDFELVLCNGDYKELCKTLITKIESAPTIDAVPVVRCKDCKYWDTNWNPSGFEPLNPRYYCNYNDIFPTGEWFCAGGERKDDDKNLAKNTEHSMEG